MTRQEKLSNPANFVIKQPLRLYREKKRRYVRLEIAAPITFSPIQLDRPLADAAASQQTGTILNISGGGVLFISDSALAEDTYITMSLELTGCDLLTGIVGKVKRVEEDGEGCYLVGVEFCSDQEIDNVFGQANIGSVIGSFDNKVRRFLLRYIFTQMVNKRLARGKDAIDDSIGESDESDSA